MFHSEIEFLRAIARDPEDDTVRLVFADWLDENGQPVWAGLIRSQVANPDKPWLSPLPRKPAGLTNAVERWQWARGVVESITIQHGDWFGVSGCGKPGPKILAAVPTIRYVAFSDKDSKHGVQRHQNTSPMWHRSFGPGYSADDVTVECFEILKTYPDCTADRNDNWLHFGDPGDPSAKADAALSWAALEWAKREIEKEGET